MKTYWQILFLLCLSISLIFCHSGKTITDSIQHGGIKREFTIYVPKKYSAISPVPLLFNLHGYTSNASEQMWYGDFRNIADTAGFIIVHPQGSKYHDTTHWNTGGWTPLSTVDDLEFLDSLIYYMVTKFKIDPKRIYSAGMSNGGEMSYLLACKLGYKIAAIASVGGAMTPETFNACQPGRAIPILHIHGTSDQVVPYTGDRTAISIEAGLRFWARNNNCDSIPNIIAMDNTNLSDSTTAEHIVYRGVTAVEHFKIISGDQTFCLFISGLNRNSSLLLFSFLTTYYHVAIDPV